MSGDIKSGFEIGVFEGDVVLRFDPADLKQMSRMTTPSIHFEPERAREVANALMAMATLAEMEKSRVVQ